MKSHYNVAELAELAGVTVKALHHYDRLGLLRPRRSNAGYRLYVARDLERLEQIVALKSIGLTLEQISVVLDGDVHALASALRAQRQTLEKKRAELTRAIRAIERVESTVSLYRALSRGGVLNRLIEAIDMQNDLDVMQRYFKTDAAWARGRSYFEQWPSEPWRELFREIQASLREDPASDHARSLAVAVGRALSNGHQWRLRISRRPVARLARLPRMAGLVEATGCGIRLRRAVEIHRGSLVGSGRPRREAAQTPIREERPIA